MEEGLFTPPAGSKVRNIPQRKHLLRVTGLVKKEMTFVIRPKIHAGLERILDKDGEEVGHIAYDLLRYFVRAAVLQSIVSRDGVNAMKESVRTQCREFELNVDFFDWLMVCKIGNKLVSEYLWRGLTTAVDSGMRKVNQALVEPSTANIGRFLPTDVYSLNHNARDLKIWEAAKKLFLDCLNLPAGCIKGDDIDLSALPGAVPDMGTCGLFRNFFGSIEDAKWYDFCCIFILH